MKEHGFPKRRRLLKNEQFKSVIAHRRRFSDGILTVFIAPNDCGFSRIGVSVGKQIGPAVVRNRIKRLIREAFRLNLESMAVGFDFVAIAAKNAARNDELQKISGSLLGLVKHAG